MKSLTNILSQHFENVPDRLRKRKLLVWLFFIAATVFFVVGMSRTKFDMTVESWFEKDDPTIVAFDGFHAEFGSEDNLFIVYKPKDGNVFSAESLNAIKGIREDLLNYKSRLKEGEKSALKHIVKINTLVNAPVLEAKGDSLISRHLTEKTIPTSQQDLEKIRRTAESQKKFPLLYFSKDLRYGGIFIETDFGAIPMDSEPSGVKGSSPEHELNMDDMIMQSGEGGTEKRIRFKPTDLTDYLALMREIKVILNKPQYADHLEYYPVGNTAATEYDLKVIEEMGFLNIVALSIMILLLWFLFRSFSAVLWPILIVVLSVIWTIGLAGWLGATVTAFIMLTVMLTLTIGMADSVHILSGYLFFRNKNHDHQSASQKAFRSASLAMLLTAITNMIGILALNITPIVPIQTFSIMSAAGVALAFLFTIYLLPLLLDLWSPVIKQEAKRTRPNKFAALIGRYIPNFSRFLQQLLDHILPVVQKRPASIALIFLAFLCVCVYGSTRVKVDTNPIGQYPEHSKIRESFQLVDRKMMGAQNMEIFLDLGEEYAFQDPMALKIMDELQQKLEANYSNVVVRTSSLIDVVKDSYQKLNEGKEEMYTIPENQKVLSETLFLFNNANPEDRRKLVSDDYRKAHISVQLLNTGSYEYVKIFESMRNDINESVSSLKQKYPGAKVSITGMLALMMQAADYITRAELQSFGLALLVISFVLLVVFGSYKAGLIAIIPNLIPAILAFGLMGWFDIPLDFNTMMLAPIIIGIAVDDTVHFITQYRGEVLVDGNINRALVHTLKETGQAITFTALVLGLGFGIMAFASSAGTSNMGKFGSLAVFAGLLNDLFLLPALILVFKFSFQAKRADEIQVDMPSI